MAFISKSNWSRSCNANPLHKLSFSRWQGNKWSDWIWTDLAAILKSNFLLPLFLRTATAGENYGSKKNKASAVLSLAALSKKNFCIFPWMKKDLKKKDSCAGMLPKYCQTNTGNPPWVQSFCIPHWALHGKGSEGEEEGKLRGAVALSSSAWALLSLSSGDGWTKTQPRGLPPLPRTSKRPWKWHN